MATKLLHADGFVCYILFVGSTASLSALVSPSPIDPLYIRHTTVAPILPCPRLAGHSWGHQGQFIYYNNFPILTNYLVKQKDKWKMGAEKQSSTEQKKDKAKSGFIDEEHADEEDEVSPANSPTSSNSSVFATDPLPRFYGDLLNLPSLTAHLKAVLGETVTIENSAKLTGIVAQHQQQQRQQQIHWVPEDQKQEEEDQGEMPEDGVEEEKFIHNEEFKNPTHFDLEAIDLSSVNYDEVDSDPSVDSASASDAFGSEDFFASFYASSTLSDTPFLPSTITTSSTVQLSTFSSNSTTAADMTGRQTPAESPNLRAHNQTKTTNTTVTTPTTSASPNISQSPTSVLSSYLFPSINAAGSSPPQLAVNTEIVLTDLSKVCGIEEQLAREYW